MMAAEDNKNIPPGVGDEKKPPEKKTAPPPKKPDFDEEKLRREVPSLPLQKLSERFPESIEEVSYYAGEVIIRVPKEKFLDICSFLKEDSELEMDYLSCISGIDYPNREKRFDLVYHIYSIKKNHRLTLKISVAEGESAPSVTTVWKTANWHERETYDLVGIFFSDHPALERILTPENFEGHPLRKDFPLEGRADDHIRYR
ncbi:MAG: NADH-quinone oxidoreductase subunit C [Acidobacteriota bacterium]